VRDTTGNLHLARFAATISFFMGMASLVALDLFLLAPYHLYWRTPAGYTPLELYFPRYLGLASFWLAMAWFERSPAPPRSRNLKLLLSALLLCLILFALFYFTVGRRALIIHYLPQASINQQKESFEYLDPNSFSEIEALFLVEHCDWKEIRPESDAESFTDPWVTLLRGLPSTPYYSDRLARLLQKKPAKSLAAFTAHRLIADKHYEILPILLTHACFLEFLNDSNCRETLVQLHLPHVAWALLYNQGYSSSDLPDSSTVSALNALFGTPDHVQTNEEWFEFIKRQPQTHPDVPPLVLAQCDAVITQYQRYLAVTRKLLRYEYSRTHPMSLVPVGYQPSEDFVGRYRIAPMLEHNITPEYVLKGFIAPDSLPSEIDALDRSINTLVVSKSTASAAQSR
jgi:hypothetical protein